MIIGFTGTQKGMTQRQQEALKQLFCWLNPSQLRHGDCFGSDEQAHDIFMSFRFRWTHNVVIHPPINPSKRVFKEGIICKPLPYLQRNKYIAGCIAGFKTDLLIAAPGEDTEQIRFDSWMTIRYARKCGTPRIILLP